MVKLIFLFKIVLFFMSYLTFAAQAQERSSIVKYVFIGHCYHPDISDKVDHRIETLDFSPYTGIWLGGDVCSAGMVNYSTVEYIDSLFTLNNPETHWALGNHDARNGNWDWYEEFTNRETFYSFSSNGITRIIMNTNIVPYNCELLDAQFELIQNVCDTVTPPNKLILIMHHGIWRDVPDLIPPILYAHSDLKYWNSNCYDVNSTFVNSIYQLLVEVEQNGVDVYCVLGDMGSGVKIFDEISVDGINFIGCGLHSNSPDDNVLIFEIDPETNNLNYNFHNLDSLLLVN